MRDIKGITYKGIKAAMLAGVLAFAGAEAVAFELPAGTKSDSYIELDVTDINRSDNGEINVELSLGLEGVRMSSNIETLYTPMFVNGGDTLRMGTFAVTGRNRLYSDRRNNRLPVISFYKGKPFDSEGLVQGIRQDGVRTRLFVNANNATNDKIAKNNNNAPTYTLEYSTPYREWMETAVFTVDVETRGCANCLKENPEGLDFYPLAQNDFVTHTYQYVPEFIYITPVAEAVKMREISARAYIDFVVNRTEINPTYRRNPQELAKIRATIDSVENDRDIRITSLHISGTASPEGSYQNNVRLAKGRTESLSNYVQGLYKFPKGVLTTSYEPVDWKGLAEYLAPVATPGNGGPSDSIRYDQFQNMPPVEEAKAALPHAREILAIVDSDIEPYARNSKIRSTYPKEYAWLLANVYPGLRHSDYKIEFEIKTFTEVSEIIEVMQTSPQKLSLAELFVAANSQEPGSELYNRAFEIAVAMYPRDETANLNAGVNAMRGGDMTSAQRYLGKAGNSVEADYARAVYAMLSGDEETAKRMFNELANSGNAEIQSQSIMVLQGLEAVKKANEKKWSPL